jgi:hypothetical protein
MSLNSPDEREIQLLSFSEITVKKFPIEKVLARLPLGDSQFLSPECTEISLHTTMD